MGNIFEILMLLAFGASWPLNLHKALVTRSAKGISLGFLCLVEFGYICGVVAKVLNHQVNYVIFFYMLNICAVAVNITVYFINRRRERQAEAKEVLEELAEEELLAK